MPKMIKNTRPIVEGGVEQPRPKIGSSGVPTPEVKDMVRRINEIFRVIVNGGGLKGVEMDKRILRFCVERYREDLGLFEKKRGYEADPHKEAAFVIKWISKLKPIQLFQTDQSTTYSKLYANEILAFYCGMNILDVDMPLIPLKYLMHFLRNLHDYPVVAETLASEMYLLQQCAKGNWAEECRNK
ncbi:MAG: hypothetical protein HQL75_11585 [Magnetococcales bacterium]|nr:hypothetical protein [Magnetococcales bacterium]